MKQVLTGIGVKIQGHLKIVEYNNYSDYIGGRPNQVLLNKRNAVHKDNASILLANALTNHNLGSICYMVFGNGGTKLNSTGTVIFNPPNDTGPNANLYHPTYFQMVDDTLGAIPGNQMAVRHISNSLFSDVDIRCFIGANAPMGQVPSNLITGLNLNTNTFSFNEIGLKLLDGTLITHVIFSPVLKHAEALIEVIYTLRLFVGQPPVPEPPPVTVDLPGAGAVDGSTNQVDSQIGTFGFNYRVHGVRMNDSPYFANIPQVVSNSSQGSLSLFIRGTDIFNMAHDQGPALLSSSFRNSFNISGRGYIRRNPINMTRAASCEINIPNHGLVTGNTVQFTNVGGSFASLQGTTQTITFVDANHFTIPVNTSGFGSPYTGPALLTFVTATPPEYNTLRVTIMDDDVNPTKIFYWNSSEQIPANEWVNLLISWDMNHGAGQKILQVYVNDTKWTSTTDSTYVYDPDASFTIPYVDSRKWMLGEPIVVPSYIKFGQVAREVLRSRT